jgi:hypothetical protein
LALAVLLAALTTTGALAYARFGSGRPALRDFLSFYAGARLFSASPPFTWSAAPAPIYSVSAQRDLESRLRPGAPYLPCLRPPLFWALAAPLSRLSLENALIVWLALNAAAAAVMGLWAAARMREPAMLLLLALFVPLIVSLSVGQDTPLLVLLLLGFLALLERGRPAAAAVLLSMLWVKPQWLPPFVLLLLARREWRALGVLAGISAAIWAVFSPLPYLRFLNEVRHSPGVPACLACMPNVRGLAAWLGGVEATGLAAAVGAGAAWAMVYVGARRSSISAAFALACAAALLAGYYSHIYDCLLLVPAVAVASGRLSAQWQKLAAGIALSPLPYLASYWSPALRGLPAMAAAAVFAGLWATKERDADERG